MKTRSLVKEAAFLLFCTVLLGACATPRAVAPPPKLAWSFQPDRRVQLIVDGKPHFVTQAQPPFVYTALAPSELEGYHIPRTALLAAYSWHAGFGDVIYAVAKPGRIVVLQREMDEIETSRYSTKQIAEIPSAR